MALRATSKKGRAFAGQPSRFYQNRSAPNAGAGVTNGTKGVRVQIAEFITRYGDLAVFIGSGLEGESVAFVSGLMAHNGLLSWQSVFLSAGCGSFLTDQLWFLAGRYGRKIPFVRRLLHTTSMSHVFSLVDRYQSAFVVAFRFVYGMRILGPLAVGASGMPAYKFVSLNAFAAFTWAYLITTIGYYSGSIFKPLLGEVGGYWYLALAILGAALLIVALLAVRRRLISHAKALACLRRGRVPSEPRPSRGASRG